ncbi:MAG TPA: hypothetical protein VMZ53_31755 [Kofleriaceae bacterium]|nr:hypothetical protein [Kofleriaceae bacterium]
MKAIVALLLACAGCDAVFSVDHVREQLTPDADVCAQGDEDCDHRANASDACPADFDTMADADGDGVGDACDPDPAGAEGNHIAQFDGFDNNLGGWGITSGRWELGGGVFKQPETADTRVEKTVSMKFPSVEIIVLDLSTVGNGSVSAFGLAGASDVRCSVFKRESDGVETLEIGGVLLPGKQVALSGTGPLRIMGGQRQDGMFYCTARHGTNVDAIVMSGVAGPVTIDKVGFATSSASTTISSITLYDVPMM